LSELRFAETETLPVPEPAFCVDVFEPYEVLVPYSTYQLVDWPPGFTVPPAVADVGPTAETGPVMAVGAAAYAAPARQPSRINPARRNDPLNRLPTCLLGARMACTMRISDERKVRAMPTKDLRRVSVVGVSGSGKSTFGRRLAERIGAPYVELDALHHGPGWTEATAEELRARVGPLVEGERWVIDGNYQRKLGDLVVARADTVVWLDLPVRVWFPRLARRTFGRALTRQELWNGNREQLRFLVTERPNIFGWAWRSHRRNRRELEPWVAAHPNARLVRLRSPREVERFLADVG
jgi:adenylate kinase family enzyme